MTSSRKNPLSDAVCIPKFYRILNSLPLVRDALLKHMLTTNCKHKCTKHNQNLIKWLCISKLFYLNTCTYILYLQLTEISSLYSYANTVIG